MIAVAPTPSCMAGLRALWQEAFGDSDAFLDTFFAAAFAPERCLCILDGGIPVAALYWFDCLCDGQTVAYIYAVATAGSHRGRGLCRALMEQTYTTLSARGYAGALLVPGDAGLSAMYSRMGYAFATGVTAFSVTASDGPAPLTPLTPAAYAACRRALLPPYSVVQEGENLAFLSAQAALYGGDGWVCAVRRDGGRAVGLEWLGDRQAAPDVVSALGCTDGTFRTCGDTPFAMWHALSAARPPAYFAFAFD